jgi:hypothetical protein
MSKTVELKENEQVVTVESNQRVVIMTDTMQDCIDTCIEQTKDALIEVIQEDISQESADDFMQDLQYDGRDHEIIDGNVPIMIGEINDLYYIYGSEIDSAYENHGLGDKTEDNWIQVGIFCHLQDETNDEINSWLEELVDSMNAERERLVDEFETKQELVDEFRTKEETYDALEEDEKIIDEGEDDYVETRLKDWLEKHTKEE